MSELKKAIYAGSFDPITNGHIDIIKRGLEVFDEIVLLLAISPDKKSLFTFEERRDQLKKIFLDNKRVKVDIWDSLTVDFAKLRGIKFLLRGLRSTGDFDKEFQIASMNKKLNPNLETFFLLSNSDYDCVSSSLIKEIFLRGGDVSKFVPDYIRNELLKKRK